MKRFLKPFPLGGGVGLKGLALDTIDFFAFGN